MQEVQVKRQSDSAINATDTGYFTVTHGHKVPISTFTPIRPESANVPRRLFLAVGRGKSKTTELFKSRDDDDEANSPFSGAALAPSLAAVSTKAATSHINMKLAGNALTFS